MKKKKWHYVRDYHKTEFLGETIYEWRYRFRFNEEKAEELIKLYPFESAWVQLSEAKRRVLLSKIIPDGEDYKLKKDGQK